jgi:GTP-binding protein
MFVDEIKIYARAGHGGKGCVAFRREAFAPKGGPSGGNGGLGGNVILQADRDLNNLIAQYYQPRLIAQDGKQGLGKGMDGHAGKDLIVHVPCGTLVWQLPEAQTDPYADEDNPSPIYRTAPGAQFLEIDLGAEAARLRSSSGSQAAPLPPPVSPVEAPSGPEPKGDLIADLTQHGEQFILCKGGRGGLGNRNFATAARQTPRFAQPGEPGHEGHYLLELRIIAEVGLVGYPNAGKSTLLTAISHARPKIAPYPFTTLHPQIGIVEYPDFFRLTVCDVPGLIEGAHRNVGLGHAFLRHIERCKVIGLVLDIAGSDNRTPWDDYKHLLEELELYDPSLLSRPRLIVANKIDEPAAAANLKKFKRKVPKTKILPMAAAFDEGTEEFKQTIRQAVEAITVAK